MRDILSDLEGSPADPAESIRNAGRRVLPKRFYKEVGTRKGTDGFEILLDGRPVRTPAKAFLAVPTQALADALAQEWAGQGAEIDPSTMPLTRLVNVALDGVARDPRAVADEMVRYMGTDMLLYRAEGPDRLVARQAEHWDPVLDWLNRVHGARFFLAEGIRHVAQPEDMIDRAAGLVPVDNALALTALSSITSLTGSAFLALAVAAGAVDAEAAWTAAHVDEDWNIELWGVDEAAAHRRAARKAEMLAAVRLLELSRG